MATVNANSGGDSFSKVQDQATEMLHNTIDVLRSASANLKEKLDESGVTEYSQKLASKVINQGIPTVSSKLQELLAVCWKLFVQFLDKQGYKEPLEAYLQKFQDSPFVKMTWKVLQQMFSMVWLYAVKIYASISVYFSDKEGKAAMSTNIQAPVVDGALYANGESSVATPQPSVSVMKTEDKVVQNAEGRVTPESALHFDSGADKAGPPPPTNVAQVRADKAGPPPPTNVAQNGTK
eukprot:TRINITY_DN2489_c1_g1_i2.p1 TRINITY_DN2489_c1_g1~~TRINITY_DN2489_c1_g1_i2.p1  ORF type:complete len:236 (-),score=48.08 TRINITY_DN2489_c1_g1_i2:533-1240(-)